MIPFNNTVEYPPPPPPPPKNNNNKINKCLCIERIVDEILLEHHFFPEMLKQVRTSVNCYIYGYEDESIHTLV